METSNIATGETKAGVDGRLGQCRLKSLDPRAPSQPRPHSSWAQPDKSPASDCSPTGSEIRQGPVEGQAVTEVGIVAVVLELLQGHAAAFRAQLLAPVCKQRGICEGLGLCLLRLARSFWRKK